jgi:hypothetical protein
MAICTENSANITNAKPTVWLGVFPPSLYSSAHGIAFQNTPMQHDDKNAGSVFRLPQAGREAMQARDGLHNATSAALWLSCGSSPPPESQPLKKPHSFE